MMEQKLINELLAQASEARKFATPKRSGFRVGAALLAKNGDIITGCNMELECFLTGICAERTAITKGLSMGYREFEAIAVVGDAKEVSAPCGFCRQFLVDLGLDMPVIMGNTDCSEVVIMKVSELVPMAFKGAKNMDV